MDRLVTVLELVGMGALIGAALLAFGLAAGIAALGVACLATGIALGRNG